MPLYECYGHEMKRRVGWCPFFFRYSEKTKAGRYVLISKEIIDLLDTV